MPRISFRKFALFFPAIVGIVLLLNIVSYRYHFSEGNVPTIRPTRPSDPPLQMDWLDRDFFDRENLRQGPGEHGEGVYLNASEKKFVSQIEQVNGFNAIVSDKISVHRSTKDLRNPKCMSLNYSSILPSVSIIIPFHDEHWSTLLRTVHSLVSRSPAILIKEVILVDDKSTKPFLGEDLDQYVSKNFTNVRILRSKERVGLIRARMIGARSTSGTILVFIDSHCEAGINWLPPLIQPIKDHYKTVTCPFIDVINNEDFAIGPQDEGARGAFDWNLDYKRLPRLLEDMTYPERPFDSPIMAGGLFAISSQWFWELHGYDEGLDVWGGEQYELSFKTWMCGGRMIDIPCSRIAHVYRLFNPFGVSGIGDYIAKNHKRIAEVWMDEWKDYVYQINTRRYLPIDPGNITEQKNLRLKLKCKSFRWFLENVAHDLLRQYPVPELLPMSKGRIISEANSSMCIESKSGKEGDQLKINKCTSKENNIKGEEQIFHFSWQSDIRVVGKPLCVDYLGTGGTLVLTACRSIGGSQRWIYNPKSHQIIHEKTRKCIEAKPERLQFFITICSSGNTQKWKLENMNKEVILKAWSQSGIG